MTFPFADAPNTAALTCCHVMKGQKPILYVSHDEDDGMWQFLCGGQHETSEGRLVSLHEIFVQDPSVGELVYMPCGYHAEREAADAPWRIQKKDIEGVLHMAEIPYETGELRYRYTRRLSPDGTKWIRDGRFEEYCRNGNLVSEGYYEDGFEEGYWKDYHDNGNIAAEGVYCRGKEVGTWRFYDEQGRPEEEETYGDA